MSSPSRARLALVAGITLLPLLPAACAPTGDAGSTSEGAMSDQQEPTAPIETAQAELTDEVMALAGVVGLGIGECDGTPCIKVMVVERTEELVERIPELFRGHPVVVEATGEIRARHGPSERP